MTRLQDELLRRQKQALISDELYPVKKLEDFFVVNDHEDGLDVSIWPRIRLFAVVLSIGAGSMFLVALDSVVDNLLPAAKPFLESVYGLPEDADIAWEWIVSSRIYGLAIGSLLSILVSNQPSRRAPLITAMALNFFGGSLSGLVTLINNGVVLCCFGRFLNGIGSGIIQVVGSAMIAEISPISARGTMLATLTVWACTGELTGMVLGLDTLLGTEILWNLALVAPSLAILPAILCIYWAPDSPRALLLNGDKEAAQKALEFYQYSDEWQSSLDDYMNDIGAGTTVEEKVKLVKQDNCNSKLWPMMCQRFSSGNFVRPFMLGAFILTFVHLDDWLWISYSTQVFENIGLTARAATRASLMISFPQAFISILALVIFDDFSRKVLIVIPTIMSIICSVLVIVGIKSGSLFGIWPLYIAVPALAAADLSAAAVSSESAYTVVPELFAQKDRVLGTAIIGILQNVLGGLLTTTALSIVNKYGTQFVLGPFLLMNMVYIIGIWRYLPETNGISATAIAMHFRSDLPSLRNSEIFRQVLSFLGFFYGRHKVLNVIVFVIQLTVILFCFYGVCIMFVTGFWFIFA
ncbi:unnamed protein product [Bursaphelenchus okinawaensis]|uniref:Major facilitator superfamily (MFS) profile domain-containing protein n=1 Tax=Bursaphelenchus okinawaensis TaxID=465554 RepID=A0A811KCG1_9BILA|nr:unnamed protein product [Bursaphelenchus okinawaensis]CAG9100897.1 unnamed protein product [Bursaphelenchus okinawaensis]